MSEIPFCGYNGKVIMADKEQHALDWVNLKMNWCPLRTMPDYQEVHDVIDNYYGGYAHGWNDCLERIVKK